MYQGVFLNSIPVPGITELTSVYFFVSLYISRVCINASSLTRTAEKVQYCRGKKNIFGVKTRIGSLMSVVRKHLSYTVSQHTAGVLQRQAGGF